MVIKLKLENQMIWPLFFLLLAQFFAFSEKLLFIAILVWMIMLLVRNNRVIITIPRVYGLKYFMLIIVVATFLGLLFNDMRDVVKDLYYILPSTVMIIIGYLYYGWNNGKSLKKTLYVSGTVISIMSLIKIVTNIDAVYNLESIRGIMGLSVYEVVMIVGVMFAEKIICRKIIFSSVKDWIMIFMMILKCILSSGRTELIELIIMIVMVLILNVVVNKDRTRALGKAVKIATVMILLFVVIYSAIPAETKNAFMDKMDNSFEEINSNNEYDSTMDAMQNWRGFEIEQAKKQWESANVFTQLAGEGFGTYIYVEYLPYEFTDDMYKDHSIALLHNTYYSLLIKTGIAGVAALLWLYISNALAMFFPKNRKYMKELSILTVITAGMIFMTYITRGIFTQTMIITWGITVGWINAEIRGYKINK